MCFAQIAGVYSGATSAAYIEAISGAYVGAIADA